MILERNLEIRNSINEDVEMGDEKEKGRERERSRKRREILWACVSRCENLGDP